MEGVGLRVNNEGRGSRGGGGGVIIKFKCLVTEGCMPNFITIVQPLLGEK